MVDYIYAACRGRRTYMSPEEIEEMKVKDLEWKSKLEVMRQDLPQLFPPEGYISRSDSEMADLWVPGEISSGDIITAKFKLHSTREGRTEEAYAYFGADPRISKGRLGRICDGLTVTGAVTEFEELYDEDSTQTKVRLYKIEIVPEDKMPLHRLMAFEDHEKSLDSERGLERGLIHFGLRDSTGLCLYLYRGEDLLIERAVDIFPTTSIDEGGLERLIIRGVIKDATQDL